jgi:hypothetical protein
MRLLCQTDDVFFPRFNLGENRQVILLDPATIEKPTKEMNKLASAMLSQNVKGMERRGKLLQYFHETGQAKLRAVW